MQCYLPILFLYLLLDPALQTYLFCFCKITLADSTLSPISSTISFDPVSSTESEISPVRYASSCNVELCLIGYQRVVTTETPTPVRCQALKQLQTCMERAPSSCASEDERYALIDSKRQQSVGLFNCFHEGALHLGMLLAFLLH